MNLRNCILGAAYGIQGLCWLHITFLLKSFSGLLLDNTIFVHATLDLVVSNDTVESDEVIAVCGSGGGATESTQQNTHAIDITDVNSDRATGTLKILTTENDGEGTCKYLVKQKRGKNTVIFFAVLARFLRTTRIFVERVGNFSSCASRFVVFEGESMPCFTIFSHDLLRIHMTGNATLTLKSATWSEAPMCPENPRVDLPKMDHPARIDSNQQAICEQVQGYDDAIVCPIIENFEEAYPGEYYRHIHNITACNVSCFQECKCTLAWRTFRQACQENSTKTSDVLITYTHPIVVTSLYWGSRRINNLDKDAFSELTNLEILWLHNNELEIVKSGTFDRLPNLLALYLWGNKLKSLECDLFNHLTKLKKLYLHKNRLKSLNANVFSGLTSLSVLYINNNELTRLDGRTLQDLNRVYFLALDHNLIRHLPAELFRNLTSLQNLLLGNNSIDKLGDNIFAGCESLESVDLRDNSLHMVRRKTFEDLTNLTTVFVDSHGTCCFFQYDDACIATDQHAPVYLTCERLLSTTVLRVGMWILGFAAVFGNIYVFLYRCRLGDDPSERVQFLLIANLAIADLLMGIYLLILTSADEYYKEYFPSYAESWRKGPLCKFAGILSVISSETSIFLITLISIDRLMGIKYSFSAHRPKEKAIKFFLVMLWLVAFLLAVVPTTLPNIDPRIYDVSEVCIGLPLTRRDIIESKTHPLQISYKATKKINVTVFETIGTRPAMYLSIAIFIGLNLLCILVVVYCYVCMFISVRKTSKQSARHRNVDEEIWMTVKMSAIVITDFICWAPIIILCALVQCDVVRVSPVIYTWIVAFILPINSATNPYVYTLVTLITKSWRRLHQKQENCTERSYTLVEDTQI